MARVGLALVLWVLATWHAAMAQEATPVHRYLYTRDVDFYGADLGKLFDTTQTACERACSAQEACVAFTFNQRSNSCFPKSEITEKQPYEGALSAVRVETSDETEKRAADRAASIGFVGPDAIADAVRLVRSNARRFAVDGREAADLLAAFDAANGRGDAASAVRWLTLAIAVTDRADLWVRLAEYGLGEKRNLSTNEMRRLRSQAIPAAVNGYLRAPNAAGQAQALAVLARGLEANRQGRRSIDALKLALTLTPREDLEAALDKAIGKYGFRVTRHRVDNNAAEPRICAEFSEPLVQTGVDYEPFVRVEGRGLVVQADQRQLCLDGVEHGARYDVTLRSGLPARSGEVLHRDVRLRLYVRDRDPLVRFPGRAFVLPRSTDAALPVETVNVDTLDLTLRKISDRNVLRAIQEGFFARPLSYWQDQRFSTQMAQDIWSGTAQTQNTLNADLTTRLPMAEALDGQDPGIYALTARVPGADPYDAPGATQWFVLTSLGLSTWQGVDGLSVAVRDLGSVDVRPDVELTLVSRANAVLGTAKTDAEGFAHFPAGLTRGRGSAAPALLVAQAGAEDMAFLPLTDPAFDLSDRGVEGHPPAPPIDTFLTTDRGAYRVGETVHATALLRDDQMRGLPSLPLTALIYRPDGVEYRRETSAQNAAGGHVFALALGGDVPRGTWRIELRSDLNGTALASQSFLVEDFLPERLDFDMTLPDRIRIGDTPPLAIEARYLFGAPAAGLPVEGDSRLRHVRTLADWPGYMFGLHDQRPERRSAALPAGETAADGSVTVPLTLPDLERVGLPVEAEVIVRVREGSGHPVERRITKEVATGETLIGVRARFEDDLPEMADAVFDLVAIGPDGTAQPMNARWTLNKVRTRYQWYQVDGNWAWEPVTRRIRVAQGEVALGSNPAELSLPTEWGRYELVVDAADGTFAATSVTFSAGWYGAADGSDTPDRLDVSLDAPDYVPGDTAQVRIVAPADGVGLLTVLSNQVIERRSISLREGANVVEVPVTADWGTGAYITVSALRPMDVAAGRNPARAMGLVHAALRPSGRKLTVDIDAPEAVDGQAGTLPVTIRVDGVAEGETAWVTLAAVDEGILNLTGFAAPDPSDHYFAQRRLGVEIRDAYGRLIDGLNGALGTVRSGGDAAGSLSMQAPPPTEKLMAAFSGLIEVGPDGVATVDIPKPAFNGTVRLMAVAWSQSSVGNASRDVLARDPVVVTASLPRFLAPDDQSRLLLEFVHADGPAGKMPLRVTSGAIQLGDVPPEITLPKEGSRWLDIPITSSLVGDHTIEVALGTPDGKTLRKTLALGVRNTDPAVANTRRFTLAPGQTFSFDTEVLAGLHPGTAEATLSAGPLARLDMPGLLNRLNRYPYGCTEQVTSAAMPLLYLGSLAGSIGIGDPQQLEARIDKAIARVLARQASNGAFGLWRAGSGEFWLDAYVTDFLSRARATGHDVPDLAFSLAMDNLRNRVNYAPDFDQGGEDIAYALMVLAREGAAAMGDLRYYADTKAEAFRTPLAAAQLASALALYGDQLRADRMFARAGALLMRRNDETSPQWRADFGTSLRDAAGVLKLAAEVRSDAVDQIALAQWIGRATDGFSTQEAAQIALAAHAMSDPGAVSGLEVDGSPATGQVVRRLDQDSAAVAVRNTSSTATDVTVTTFGVPVIPPDAGGYGYALTRALYTMEGDPVAAPIVAGDRMVVVLTVTPFEDVGARLIVDDPLPAGFEIDNPNILRGGDIRAMEWLKPAPVQNAEFRADRFVAAVDHRGSKPFTLAYVVRAVTPGAYHHPAATVSDMYRPGYQARTATTQVTVSP